MFHVPEAARVTDHPQLGTTEADGNNGAFDIGSSEPGWRLSLICSDGLVEGEFGGWEHVSVHAYRRQGKKTQARTPSWDEMAFVKTLCWDDADIVMQLHPARSEYVNVHPHVLHLWRPLRVPIPTPPRVMV